MLNIGLFAKVRNHVTDSFPYIYKIYGQTITYS